MYSGHRLEHTNTNTYRRAEGSLPCARRMHCAWRLLVSRSTLLSHTITSPITTTTNKHIVVQHHSRASDTPRDNSWAVRPTQTGVISFIGHPIQKYTTIFLPQHAPQPPSQQSTTRATAYRGHPQERNVRYGSRLNSSFCRRCRAQGFVYGTHDRALFRSPFCFFGDNLSLIF